jgi:hypothetical protein
MNIQKTIQEQLRVPALLLAAFSLIAIGGCKGMTDAPFGSTITVEAFGTPILSNMTITASASKTQRYRATVADKDKLPLNDIDINFVGQFTNGQSIDFGGTVGSVPTAAGTVTLSAIQKTDAFGYVDFLVTAPYYDTTRQIHEPYNQTAVGAATGGQLVDGTYLYQITALDFAGETNAVAPISAVVTSATTTGTTGSVVLTWTPVPGATSYIIYGRGTPLIRGLINIINPTLLANGDATWTDTGSNIPSTRVPPAANSTGVSLNSVIGTAQASTGAAFATFDIKF